MKSKSLALLILTLVSFVVTISCSFTLPSAPLHSRRIVVTSNGSLLPFDLSEQAEVIVAVAPTDVSRNSLKDEAVRCENRLSALVRKMRAERNTRVTMTLIGGSAGIAGTTSAALADDKGAKIASAVVGAVGTLAATVAGLVGDPATDMKRYQESLQHYEAARSYAAAYQDGRHDQCGIESSCYLKVRFELAMCNDDAAALVVPPPAVSDSGAADGGQADSGADGGLVRAAADDSAADGAL